MPWALFFAALAFLVMAGLILLIVRQAKDPSPAELFETIWRMTKDNLFEPDRLSHWQLWQERAGKLDTHQAAFDAAERLLLELEDPYTLALTRAKQDALIRWEKSEYVGIGVLISTAYEQLDESACQLRSAQTGESCRYPTITGVFYNSPAAQSGLQAGDVITSIDGWSTAGSPLSTVLSRLHGKNRTALSLVIERNGTEKLHVMQRSFATIPTSWSRMIDDRIGYWRLTHFESGCESYGVMAAQNIKDCAAVIVDMRDNRGGEVYKAIRLCSMFIFSGLVTRLEARITGTPSYKRTRCYIEGNKLVEETDGIKQTDTESHDLPDKYFAGKLIVVLVNENTCSSAELFAGALRDSADATILGARTFGKGVTQTRHSLPIQGQLRVTSGRYFLPNGQWVGDGAHNRRGMLPHKEVHPQSRLFDMGSDNDQQLKAAVQYLRQRLPRNDRPRE